MFVKIFLNVVFFLSPSIVVNFSKSQNSSKQEMAIFLGYTMNHGLITLWWVILI